MSDVTGAESAPTVETAPEGPRTIEQAIAAYAAEDAPRPESHAEIQERDESGRFVATETTEEPAPEAEAPAAPTADDEDDEDDAPPPATDAEADAPPEDAAPEDEAKEEAPEGEPYTLKLPGRREGDEDLEIQIDGLDAATQERLAQLRNGYLRGEEVRERDALVSAKEGELRAIAEDLAADPAGFLVEHVAPAMQRDTALALMARLMETDAYAEIVDKVNEWEQDPEARRTYLEEQEAHRPPPAEVRQNLSEVRAAVSAYLPEGADAAAVRDFQRDAYSILTAYVNTKRIDSLDPAKVPGLIAAVAEEYGFHAPTSKATEPPAPEATAPAPAKAPAPEKIAAARQHGAKLVSASARRREATAVSPPGPGAVAQSGTPPKGQSIEDRIKWYASQK